MAEIWKCGSCDWTGNRFNCDSHIRTTNHSVYPKPATVVHVCGATVNSQSLVCYRCNGKV